VTTATETEIRWIKEPCVDVPGSMVLRAKVEDARVVEIPGRYVVSHLTLWRPTHEMTDIRATMLLGNRPLASLTIGKGGATGTVQLYDHMQINARGSQLSVSFETRTGSFTGEVRLCVKETP
jgi:hypothetical protein